MQHKRFCSILARWKLAGTVVAVVVTIPLRFALSAPQTELHGGLFFEAEAYEERLRGKDFAQIFPEPLGSGGGVLTGLWRDGLISYDLTVPQAGRYSLWLRCAVPSDATLKFGFDVLDSAKLLSASVPKTAEKLDAPNAYQWRRLGEVDLPQGEVVFIVGQGALRPDCFFLTPQADFTATDDLLAQLAAQREVPKGEPLPELVHTRRITHHPQWLKNALRVCYAHFEWDREMTAEKWSERAAQSGANCLFGVGEMPAGALDGRLKAFSYDVYNRDPAAFRFPEGYDLSYGWAKDFTDAAHAQGLKIAIYDGAFRSLDPLLVEHPEWRQVDVQGQPYPNGFGSWHSPYRQAYIDRWVRVARLARFDGIMIDMLFTGPKGGDYSEYTVRAFKDRFGGEPPREPDPRNLTWQRWIDFQTWTREEVLLDLTEALHAVDPEIAVIVNQTVGWIFNATDSNFLSSRAADCCDGLLEEMGWEYSHNWTRPWAWPSHSAWQNLFLHCRTRPGYRQMWHMLLNFPEVHALALSYSMLANGTAPGMVTGGNWPVMAKAWQHIKDCEPWVENAQLVPWLGIHFGEDTLHWYANARGEEVYMAYLKNVFGFFQAALELHLPVEILTDDNLADQATLRRYATVLLPNSACLSDAQVAALDTYVKQGGGLVASYETGRYDPNGTRRGAPALRALIGVNQYGPVQATTWQLPLKELNHPILDHSDIRDAGNWNQGQSVPATTTFLYTGPATRRVGAVATSPPDADSFSAPLVGAGAIKPVGAPETLVYNALVARQVGRGKVVFFPIDLGHAYYVFNHPVNRRLIARALEWTAAYPSPIRTDALMSIQTVVYEKAGARLVHVVNDISSFGRAAAPNPEAWAAFRAEVAPVHNVKVGVRGTYTNALLLPKGTVLDVTMREGWTEAVVPRMDLHTLVLFRP